MKRAWEELTDPPTLRETNLTGDSPSRRSTLLQLRHVSWTSVNICRQLGNTSHLSLPCSREFQHVDCVRFSPPIVANITAKTQWSVEATEGVLSHLNLRCTSATAIVNLPLLPQAARLPPKVRVELGRYSWLARVHTLQDGVRTYCDQKSSHHPTSIKENLVRFPAVSLPDFRTWEPCRMMPMVGGFSRVGKRIVQHSGAVPYLPRLILTGSQDHFVYGVTIGERSHPTVGAPPGARDRPAAITRRPQLATRDRPWRLPRGSQLGKARGKGRGMSLDGASWRCPNAVWFLQDLVEPGEAALDRKQEQDEEEDEDEEDPEDDPYEYDEEIPPPSPRPDSLDDDLILEARIDFSERPHAQRASLARFHVLSSIHTKNSSSAVAPYCTSCPHSARLPSPKTAGRWTAMYASSEGGGDACDASQSHKNILTPPVDFFSAVGEGLLPNKVLPLSVIRVLLRRDQHGSERVVPGRREGRCGLPSHSVVQSPPPPAPAAAHNSMHYIHCQLPPLHYSQMAANPFPMLRIGPRRIMSASDCANRFLFQRSARDLPLTRRELRPGYLQKRWDNKGYTVARIKCACATKRKALECTVFVLLRVPYGTQSCDPVILLTGSLWEGSVQDTVCVRDLSVDKRTACELTGEYFPSCCLDGSHARKGETSGDDVRCVAMATPRQGPRLQARPLLVCDDAVGRRVFSGISRFPRPFILALLHTHFNHPHRLSRHRRYESSKSLHFTRVCTCVSSLQRP
ncbi:hypothetical protein PR048_020387 [Dryococelus australis]|uniref:Uncharacterized protein n=1 Tax=Dryococelus australis TaxID=614101 RepID=A0ABQ9H671_9NEOP|nr:hypothetical protein PR048_020387 [Dryococelus australis]